MALALPLHRVTGLFCLLLLPALLSFFSSPLYGQPPISLLNASPGEPESEKMTTPELLEQLLQLKAKAQQSLSRAQPVLEATPAKQLGATPEEVKEKQLLLFMRVFFYEKHIESIRSLQEIRRASEDFTAKSEAWKGFAHAPPYSISLVDELRDAIHAQSLSITKEEVSKNLIQLEQDEAREALLISEKNLRQVEESLDKSLQGSDKIRANWLYELALLKNEVAEADLLASKPQLQAIDESLSLHNKQQTFIERQLRVAVADAPFAKEELDQKLAALAKKLASLEKDKQQAISGNNRNQEKLHQARIALQLAREPLAQQGEGEKEEQVEATNYLQAVVETRKAQADTSAQMTKHLKLWVIAIKNEILFWEDRYQLASSHDETERQQAAAALDKRLERLQENRHYAQADLSLAQNMISNEKQRLAAGNLVEKERLLAQQKLAAYTKQAAFTTKLLVDINDIVRNTERFQEEVDYYRQQMSIGEQINAFFELNIDFAENMWRYELFVVEDTIYVNGQPVIAQRPVTISKLVRALLMLALGLWLTILLKNRLSGLVAKLFKIEAGAALLIEKFLLSIIIFSLLIFALFTVKIPLTIFAFMGGALAIGVGFGAQALINNFISGIILLFERPIKPGDLIEVEGTRGKVVSIGLRCSHVRRFDGIDILVPNSDFLQKSVVNWTLSDQLIRLQVKIGVAYGSPTREVAHLIDHALKEHGKILKEPEPIILFDDFGASALNFKVDFWVEVLPGFDHRIIASDLRHMLDKRLREANITTAFPQLDVHLDSSTPVQLQMLAKQGGSGESSSASQTAAETEQ